MSDGESRQRMVENFIQRYGVERLRALLEALGDGESGQRIAEELQVSRERVRQWKNAFGQTVTLYQVHPDVSRALRGPPDAVAPRAHEPGRVEIVRAGGADGIWRT